MLLCLPDQTQLQIHGASGGSFRVVLHAGGLGNLCVLKGCKAKKFDSLCFTLFLDALLHVAQWQANCPGDGWVGCVMQT